MTYETDIFTEMLRDVFYASTLEAPAEQLSVVSSHISVTEISNCDLSHQDQLNKYVGTIGYFRTWIIHTYQQIIDYVSS